MQYRKCVQLFSGARIFKIKHLNENKLPEKKTTYFLICSYNQRKALQKLILEYKTKRNYVIKVKTITIGIYIYGVY